jgi:hypothetical protein
MKLGANLSNRNTPATTKVITPSMMLATKVATILSTQTTAMATAAIKDNIKPKSPTYLPGAFATMDFLLLTNGLPLTSAIYQWLAFIHYLLAWYRKLSSQPR